MGRLRSQDGWLSYVGIMAALVITMVMTVGAFKQLGFGTGSSGSAGGAATDPIAQIEVQRAYDALRFCASRQGGSYNGCDGAQIFENDPTLIPARGHVSGGGSGGAVEVRSKSATGNVFTISANGAVVTRTCTAPGRGNCPAGGRW